MFTIIYSKAVLAEEKIVKTEEKVPNIVEQEKSNEKKSNENKPQSNIEVKVEKNKETVSNKETETKEVKKEETGGFINSIKKFWNGFLDIFKKKK